MTTTVQVVQHLRPGGIETMALDLARTCCKDDKNHIISLEGELDSALENWPKLEKHKHQLTFLNKQQGIKPTLVATLSAVFRKLNADIIHTHHIGPLLYAGFATRLAGIPMLLHTEHDAWHLESPRRVSIEKLAIRLFNPTLIADATFVADEMVSKLQAKNITVIHNGVDTERFSPGDKQLARLSLRLPENAHIIGACGRLEEVKGQHYLIDAMKNLPSSTHVAFAGTGTRAEHLRNQAYKLGVSARVHFLGQLDNIEVFYQSLDVFCLPSLNEGFPLAPLEAQACGIPSVATRVGGAHETICPLSGELVDRANSTQLAKALKRMLGKTISLDPRQFVIENGDLRSMTRAYSRIKNQA